MKLCLIFLVFGLVASCRSTFDSNTDFWKRQYILDVFEINRIRSAVKIQSASLNKLVPVYGRDTFALDVLQQLFQQIERLNNALNAIIYCEFNEIYLNGLIQTGIQYAELDQEDLNTLNDMQYIPQFAAAYGLKVDHTFMQLNCVWAETLHTTERNFNKLSSHWRQQLYFKVDKIKKMLSTIEEQLETMPIDVKNELDKFVKRTQLIKEMFQQIIEMSKSRSMAVNIELKYKFGTLRGLMKELSTDALGKRLKKFISPIQQNLDVANRLMENFRRWFEDLLTYKPTYQYSDLKEYQRFISRQTIQPYLLSIPAATHKKWVYLLFAELYPSIEKIYDHLAVRILDLSVAYVEGVIALMKKDQKYDSISMEIVKLLNDYKELYKSNRLVDIISFMKFNYFRLIDQYMPRILSMKENELEIMDNLLLSKIQSVQEMTQHVADIKSISAQLWKLTEMHREKSIEIRMIDLYELKMFYTRNDTIDKSDRLNEIKSNLKMRIDDVKKIHNDNGDAIKAASDNLNKSLSLAFGEIAKLPQQLEYIFKSEPGKANVH